MLETEMIATQGSPEPSTPAVEAPAAQVPTPEPSSPVETQSESQKAVEIASESEEKVEIPAYKAREKFKVMDQEHQIPDFLKSLIKDEASEKQVVELLEKSFGLDVVKPKLLETRKERDQARTEYQTINRAVQEARETYQRGDIDLFLEKLAIPQERMLQWALDKVNYSQLPPEQKRIFDERRDAQRTAYSAEKQNQFYQTQLQEQQRSAKSMLLEAGLVRPDIKTFADAYDAKLGRPGAFKSEVIAQGDLAWSQSNGKVDLTPEQAIDQAMQKWRPFVQVAAMAPSASAAGSQAGAGTIVQATSKPGVIPNVQGRASSPIKSKPRSIEDIKKISAQFGQ